MMVVVFKYVAIQGILDVSVFEFDDLAVMSLSRISLTSILSLFFHDAQLFILLNPLRLY